MLKLINKEGRKALVIENSLQHKQFLNFGFEIEAEVEVKEVKEVEEVEEVKKVIKRKPKTKKVKTNE